MRSTIVIRRLLGLVTCTLGLAAPLTGQAHTHLVYPPSWLVEDSLGDPQKVGPCGVASPTAAMLTNVVTTFHPGEKVTLQWQETIAHDGWFRIAISYNNRSDLMDPVATFDATGNSTNAPIENPAVAPVLVDGLYPHNAADITTPKMWSYDLTLPQTPCTKCTLQIIQFMNHHPPGYFYHHCADISIQGASVDGGAPGNNGNGNGNGTGGTGSGNSGGGAGGCGLAGRPGSTATVLAGLILGATLLRRRRARR
jgi:hypothetical protein